MGVYLKNDKEIEYMRQAGGMVRVAMKEIEPSLAPGMTTMDIERLAQKTIKGLGGEGSFNTVPGYSWFTCTPVNNQIVHTPPSQYVLKSGDILTVDIGARVNGWHVDHAQTWTIGDGHSEETLKFLKAGKRALALALAEFKVGNRLGHVSDKMGLTIKKAGYHIVEPLVGHGVGRSVHEEPSAPGYLDRPIEKTMKIVEGLTMAIEVIYAMGTKEMEYEAGSDWSIVTADGSLAAQFEHTIVVSSQGVEILT